MFTQGATAPEVTTMAPKWRTPMSAGSNDSDSHQPYISDHVQIGCSCGIIDYIKEIL
jgi:hypothetical protein